MHYPGHLRDAFLEWIEEGYPAIARVEVNYEEQAWPARQLLTKMLRCSDVVPSSEWYRVRDDFALTGMHAHSYAAVARNLLEVLPVES